MKRKVWWALLALLAAAVCVAIFALHRWQPKLPERDAAGAPWDESWVTLGDVLGVEQPGGDFALIDNNSILTAEDTFFANWGSAATFPYTDEDGEESELNEAQLFLLLQGCRDAENAQLAKAEWIEREQGNYRILETRRAAHGDQDYELFAYETASEDNPYARGATAFAVRANYALTAELTCTDAYGGDPAAILGAFLDGFHFSDAI